jgi:PAS domain S-box-containing protein
MDARVAIGSANRQIAQTSPNALPGGAETSSRIAGRGEMADLARRFNWSRSPVGAIERWPESLLTTVNLMLSCPQPMFLWWGPELTQFYNDAYRAILGKDKHPKALGQEGRECWPEIWDVIGPKIAAVMTDGETTYQRNALIPIYRNGKLEDIYWTYTYSPVFGRVGTAQSTQIQGTLVVCNDTTDEVMAERRLRNSEKRFRRLIEEANIGIVLGDLEGNLTYLNPAAHQLLGYCREDVESGLVRWEQLTPDEFAARDRKAMELEEFGKAAPYEKAYVAKDGKTVPLLVDATVLTHIDTGRPEVAVFLADLTRLRRTEQALLQNEKLAAVGRLASSIAHEINNPLEAVMNLLYLVENDVEIGVPSDEALTHIKTAQGELARVANITRHTLRFHRQLTNPVMATKAEILEDALVLFRGKLRTAGIKVETRYSPVRPTLCYNGDLRQLCANFIGNAADASQRGGKILLREREGTDWKTNRKGIRVTIADAGSGMSKETAQHIFEPFFTTKETTGTGLGLWVSAGILKKHGARVSVRSGQGERRHGTVFSIWFPMEGVANVGALEAAWQPAA